MRVVIALYLFVTGLLGRMRPFEQVLNKPNYNGDLAAGKALQLFGFCLVGITECKFWQYCALSCHGQI